VQDLSSGRTAAVLTSSGADAGVVRFPDTTVSRASASRRRYWVLDGVDGASAFDLATLINRGGLGR
jgi:hypothetical protein